MSGGTNGKQEPVVGYLTRVAVTDIRSIKLLRWEAAPSPGWNVVVGDNGAGKTTFLRVIAYALLGEARGMLRMDPSDFLRVGAAFGNIVVSMRVEGHDEEQSAVVNIRGADADSVAAAQLPIAKSFVAGFGPFRRFTGRDAEHDHVLDAIPRIGRVNSLFDERFTLAESLAWLKLHRFKELEGDAASKALLGAIRTLVNQDGFLPNGAQLRGITSNYIVFEDRNGAKVPIEDMSDGYRSILSLTFELIRQLAAHYGADRVFNPSATAVIAPGIVLIDEVDAHLHPTWQRQIGVFLRKHFPAIQFIVTTHSPIICQAATAPTDTIYRLPRPGTDEAGHMVTGPQLDRLRYGDLADAYATDAMGHIGRSDTAYALLDQLAVLNRKEIDAGLTDDEEKEQRRLRRIFGAGPLPEKRP